MTISITIIDNINKQYLTEDYQNVSNYYFDNDFIKIEFTETNQILMLNKNNILQIVIK